MAVSPVHEACFQFRFRGDAFLWSDWGEFRKAFKVRPSSRPMSNPSGPPWERIDGRGFTLWLSEIRPADSRTAPVTWEIRLESLTSLNAEGQARWTEVCEGIERFIRLVGLKSDEGTPEVFGGSRGNHD